MLNAYGNGHFILANVNKKKSFKFIASLEIECDQCSKTGKALNVFFSMFVIFVLCQPYIKYFTRANMENNDKI